MKREFWVSKKKLLVSAGYPTKKQGVIKMMNENTTFNATQVVVFDIDSQSNVTQQLTDNAQETTLENTLLEALYPGIKVAIANVPTGFLDGFEESAVANALVSIRSNNTEYRLVGASG